MHSQALWKETKKDQKPKNEKLIRFRCTQMLFERKRKKIKNKINEKLIRFRCTHRLWLKIGDQGLAVWLADALSEAATCNLTQPVQIQTQTQNTKYENIADSLSEVVAPATCNLTKYTSQNTKRLADILSDVAAHSPCHVQLDPTSFDVRGPKRNEMTNTNTKYKYRRWNIDKNRFVLPAQGTLPPHVTQPTQKVLMSGAKENTNTNTKYK